MEDRSDTSGCEPSGIAANWIFDHFDKDRVQIIGYVEQNISARWLRSADGRCDDKLLAEKIPCLVYSRGQMPDEDMLELCNHYDVPCMVSDMSTSDLMAEVIRWLKSKTGSMHHHPWRIS